MKIVKTAIKIIGILGFIVVSFLGVIMASSFYMKGELRTDTTEEVRQKFGEFGEGEILKKVPLTGVKLAILKGVGFLSPKFDRLNNVNVYNIAYKSDGLIVTGLMVIPKREGKYPCIIYNRGGNRDAGRLSFHQLNELITPYAEQGYVVIASNYRGNNGSEGKEEFGGADVNDVMNLIPVLAKVPSADTSRIGLLGHSRGGMMAYKALQNQDVFQTAVVIAGSANKFTDIEKRPEMEKYVYSEIIPEYNTRKDEVLKDRSVVFWPEKLSREPLLILHGTADERVYYEEAVELADRLDSLGFPYQLISFEDGDHVLRSYKKVYRQKVTAWFDKYLKGMERYDEIEKRVTVSGKK